VYMGPPNISETTRGRKLNLKILLDMVKVPTLPKKISLGESRGCRALPIVNLGPPVMLETSRDRKLNFKTQLSLAMDRYSFRI